MPCQVGPLLKERKLLKTFQACMREDDMSEGQYESPHTSEQLPSFST